MEDLTLTCKQDADDTLQAEAYAGEDAAVVIYLRTADSYSCVVLDADDCFALASFVADKATKWKRAHAYEDASVIALFDAAYPHAEGSFDATSFVHVDIYNRLKAALAEVTA